MKRKTQGLDLKVPLQFIVGLVVWALAHYTGIDLSAQVEVIAGLIAGAIAGAAGPAPNVVTVPSRKRVDNIGGPHA